MSQKLNMKTASKSREQMIQEHFELSSRALPLPAVFLHFNPLKFNRVFICDLDLFTPFSSAVLYARSITPAFNSLSLTSTIIEDSQGDVCKLLISRRILLPQNSMIVICEPLLSLKDGTGTIELFNENSIAMFTDEQEFRNAGWGQQMPPGFNSEFYSEQGAIFLEKKLYKEALRKFSIGLNHEPNNLEVLIGMTCCYLQLGDLDNALAYSKRALELNPNNLKVIKLRSKCLVDSNRIQEAKALVESKKSNDIDFSMVFNEKLNKMIGQGNRTRLSRLKELVLVEWPKLISIEKIRKKLNDEGVNADRVSIRGKTAILIYDSVEKREEARIKLLSLEDSEFMLANEPSVISNF